MNSTIDKISENYDVAVVGAGNIGTQLVMDLFYDSELNVGKITVFNSESDKKGAFILDYDDVENYKVWSQGADANSNTLSDWMKSGELEGKEDIKHSNRPKWSEILEKDDIQNVFITTPSDGPGVSYTLEALERGKTVISCEKQIISNNYDKIYEDVQSANYWFAASVGGGTGIPIKIMQDAVNNFDTFGLPKELHIVPNGTMNYIFTLCGKEISLEQAVFEAIDAGFTEPGYDDPIGVVGAEIGDYLKKAAGIYNLVMQCNNVNSWMKEEDIEIENNSTEIILRYLDGSNPNIDLESKLIVSIRDKNSKSIIDEKIGSYKGDEYTLEIGMTKKSELMDIKYENNGAIIGRLNDDAVMEYSDLVDPAPGAGPKVTAGMMIRNFEASVSGLNPMQDILPERLLSYKI